jgi:hypothetical protein
MISAPSSVIPIMAAQVFPCGFLLDDREDFFQPFDMPLGLAVVLVKCCLKPFTPGCLRHFWQSRKDFLLREIDVLQGVMK